ncbi:hypothetical protein HAX54_028975, partial [Datura stramonium]|nr:hypothetical protein [Datura stramonium]
RWDSRCSGTVVAVGVSPWWKLRNNYLDYHNSPLNAVAGLSQRIPMTAVMGLLQRK